MNKLLNEYNFNWRLINEIENKGLPFTRNIGLKYANYDYIIFLDADDEINPIRLNYLDPLKENECDVIFMDYTEVYKNNRLVLKSRKDYVKFEDITAYFLHYSSLVCLFTFRKSSLDAIGGFRRIPAEDKDLIFRLSLTDARFKYIPVNSYF